MSDRLIRAEAALRLWRTGLVESQGAVVLRHRLEDEYREAQKERWRENQLADIEASEGGRRVPNGDRLCTCSLAKGTDA